MCCLMLQDGLGQLQDHPTLHSHRKNTTTQAATAVMTSKHNHSRHAAAAAMIHSYCKGYGDAVQCSATL